ncbi:LacI family DNA-binding transcriptional regulator [Paramicrobacterium agarici]|uniref:LacI family DNA-binding transcriptional regulator n=1 Tax=Paramicrobacterium agarici TaxID=630514 RepID=UPI001FE36AC1|nr:LacI family DNA-binding transcriptional regulator [Microbacterium agarici]
MRAARVLIAASTNQMSAADGVLMSALADVAKLAGVSKSTASRALSGGGYVSEATRRKVSSAAEKLGYVASPNAASLVTGRTKTVGVMIPFISRWFFGEVLEGIESQLRAHGYDMTLYNVHPSERSDDVFDYFLARKRFDGVIAVAVEPVDSDIAHLRGLGRPVVGIGGHVPGIASVAIDDVAVARLATEHLIGLGHTSIVHLGGDSGPRSDFSVPRKRRQGYERAMQAAGLPTGRVLDADMSIPDGYEAAVEVLTDARDRPTAIFAACDELAIGAIIAARRLGIDVPGQLSVIGIDGHECAPMFSLTTFEQSPHEQGMQIVNTLLDAVDRGVEPDEGVVYHPTRLKVRNSTSALRSS